jgi:hypothetical protein
VPPRVAVLFPELFFERGFATDLEFFCFAGLLFFALAMLARLQQARQNLQQPPERFSAMAAEIFFGAGKFGKRFVQRRKVEN